MIDALKAKEFRHKFVCKANERLSRILERYCEEFNVSIMPSGNSITIGHTMYPSPHKENLDQMGKEIEALYGELKEEWLAFFPNGESSLN